MKKIIYAYLITLSFFIGCKSESERPSVTVGQFSKQSIVMIGVINKILSEPDPKKMFAMAQAIESSRAVNCIPVKDECNKYYEIINKVVNLTKEGKLIGDDKLILFKMNNEFNKSLKESEMKLQNDWKTYINSQAKSGSVPTNEH
jgi:hypothetical protein